MSSLIYQKPWMKEEEKNTHTNQIIFAHNSTAESWTNQEQINHVRPPKSLTKIYWIEDGYNIVEINSKQIYRG